MGEEGSAGAVRTAGTASAPPPGTVVAAYVIVIVGVAAAWAVYAATVGARVLPLDDAYITLRNAQLLATGLPDEQFPDATPLHGATSPVHTVLVAALMRALPPLSAADVARWVAVLAYALGLLRLGLIHSRGVGPALLIVLAGLLVARTPYQLLNGLETGLAMALVAWWLVLASATEPGVGLPIVSGVLPFVRPELSVLSGIGIALSAQRRLRGTPDASALSARGDRRGRVCRAGGRVAPRAWRVMGDVALLALAAAPWLALEWHYTGSMLPPTMRAKELYFAEGTLPMATKLSMATDGLALFTQTTFPLGLALALFFVHRAAMPGLVMSIALLAAYTARFPGALLTYECRYLYVLVPLLVGSIAMAMGHRHRWVRSAGWALGVGVLICGLASFGWSMRLHRYACRFTEESSESAARFCETHIPADAVILIHDVGYLPWRTRFRFSDLVGLKTPANLAEHAALTYPSAGRERPEAIHRIALRSGARYCVVHNPWEYDHGIARALRTHGWLVRPLRPRTAQYQVYEIRPPGAGAAP